MADKPRVGAGDTARARAGPASVARDDELHPGGSRWTLWLIGALALIVPLIVFAVIKLDGPQLERDAYLGLELESRLKAQLVESWLAERRGDSRVIATDSELVERVAAFRRQPDRATEALLRNRLDAVRLSYAYSGIYLLDPQGKLLLGLGGPHEISAQTKALLPAALASGNVGQSEFYIDANDGMAALNFVAPLRRAVRGLPQPVAALVLHAEPDTWFFPTILAWPSASPSGETLLVRGEGDSVVYLNRLRHANNNALTLKRPLDDASLPAAVAIRSGQTGTIRGRDYRGIEVLAAYRPVAGTDWHLVAKLDYQEVMAPLWELVSWVGLITLAAIIAIGAVLRRLWSQQARLHRLAALSRQTRALQESEARFRAVTETARDAIVTADASGNIVGWNTAAKRMFGFAENEIVGRPLTQIIPPRFQRRAMDGFSRMMNGDPDHKDGSTAELIGRHKDDREILLERSVTLALTPAGQFYTCTMRDITERKRAEEEVRIAAAAFDSHEGVAITDADHIVLRVNQAFTQITGYSAEESVGRQMNFLKSDRHDADFYAAMWRQIQTEGTWQGEIWNRNKNGEIHPHWLTISAVTNGKGVVTHYVGTYTDITQRKEAMAALEASENWFRGIFENANTAIAATDRQGRITRFNEAFQLLLGYTADQLLCMNFADLTHPDDLTLELALFAEVLDGRRNDYRITKRCVTADGRVLWIDIAVAVIRDAQGEISNFIGMIHDITERKEQEETTRRLLAENETILRNALVGIVHLKQRLIVSCNRRFEEIFNYSPGELIGQSTEVLYDTHETYVRLGDEGYSVLGEATSYSTEVLLRHKDGSLFWGALNGRAIDPAQPAEGSIWIYADISERRRAEQETSKLLQAVEQSPVSILITNRKGVIEYVNPSFTRISGYSADEAMGRTPSMLKSEHTPADAHRELWNTILGGGVWQGILRNRRKNGELIWEQTSIAPIIDNAGEITNFVAVKEDVTERKRIEEELEAHQAHLEYLVFQRTKELSKALEDAKAADKSKDEFLANITHELRTPLSAVIGFSSLARPYCSDTRQRDYLDKVNTAGKTLAGIIDDLLDLSKIAAGRLEFEAVPFSLRQLVARSSSMISYQAREKHLDLVERIAADVPDVLIGDALRLEQILLNLLANAVKFTTQGRVELRIGLQASEARRVGLCIEVEDTGIGLREEEIALLFKPFSQADASMTRKYGGTGLGLAICKRLAKLMDGDITVSSRPGRGSTFVVKLWLKLGKPADLPQMEESRPELPRSDYEGACVLVVDDQPFNRDVVEGLLEAVGIGAYQASDGREALDLLSLGSEVFDLILMDIQMPVMDGLTATRMIRKLDGFETLPIIAMTAHTMVSDREQAIAAGMNDHIGKPFDEAGFYHLLEKWIPRHKQRSQANAATAPTSANALPPLRGVDTRAGLSLLLGDEARYRHWLRDFVTEAPPTMKQLRQALAVDATEAASMAAHALKGRMGLLGMKELAAIAAALETAIDQAAPTQDLLPRLERGVAAMCAEIQDVLGGADLPTAPLDAAAEQLPPEPTPEPVARLLAGLRVGDSDCDQLVAECLSALRNTAWAPRLRQAMLHIQNFDYAAADRLLSATRQAQAVGG